MSVEIHPRISAIVSSYLQPEHLWIVLASLRVQREVTKPWAEVPLEIIVTDDGNLKENEAVALHYGCKYITTNFGCCYSAAEVGVEASTCEWLIFPSHDNYYVPEYAARLLNSADKNNLDLVFCDLIHDPRYIGKYHMFHTKPKIGRIDKGCFMVKREIYNKVGGFTGKSPGHRTFSDGIFIEAASKICKWGRVPEPLMFHG